MEFFSGGAVVDLFETGRLTTFLKANILRQASAGVSHLHKQVHPVIHRDIACRNLLINLETSRVVVSDFGLSRVHEDAKSYGFTKSTVGPIRWQSPESLNDQKYSTASDVWMFGAMMIELMTEDVPYPHLKNVAVIKEIAFKQELPDVHMES